MSLDYTLITSEQELQAACQKIANSDHVAVDTEFKRETTYFPIPCLIQLATSELTVCIDPLKIENLQPLKDILVSPNIRKIFHASRQDLEIFYFMFNEVITPVFDTQIAASVLGYPDQIGYASLVKQVLHVELDKSQTRTDWSKRPFTPEQLAYAANDVIYLLKLYHLQLSELSSNEKTEWAEEDFTKLYDEALYKPDPIQAWQKIKNYAYLTLQQKFIIFKLSAWRETEAIKRDKPRKFILSNAAMLDIASKQPTVTSDLETITDLNRYVVQRYGNKIIEIIDSSLNADKTDCPQAENMEILSANEKKQLKQIQALLNNIAEQSNLSSSYISNRKELEKLIRGERDLEVMQGWRYKVAGKILVDAIEAEQNK